MFGLLAGEEILDDPCTLGMRDIPRRASTSLISLAATPASLRHAGTGPWCAREAAHELLELGARERHRHVLRARRVRGDERQVDVRALARTRAQSSPSPPPRAGAARRACRLEVDRLVLLEVRREHVQSDGVEVLAAEERVAVGRLDLEHAAGDLEDGDVEGAAAEIVHRDEALLLVHAVRQRGGSGLVDDAQHVQTGDLPRVLRRLPLRVVEVRRHGHDRLRDAVPEVRLRRFLHLLQARRRPPGRESIASHRLAPTRRRSTP